MRKNGFMYATVCAVAVSLLLVSGQQARASIIVGQTETFDSQGSWTFYSEVPGPSMSVGSGTMNLQFPNPEGGQPYWAYVYTSSDPFAGNANYRYYGGDLAVLFSMKAVDSVPDALSLYFMSSTSGRSWTKDISLAGTTVGDWITYAVPVISGVWNWTGEGTGDGSVVDLMNDFGDVDYFGFYVRQKNVNIPELYQFDDMSFAVPEPETVWLMLAALLSLCLTFRSKIGDMARGLFARI